jgi:regulatory protein
VKITHLEQFKKAENYAYWLLAHRDRSSKEITDRLKRKNIPEEIIQKLLDKLQKMGYINDYKFANQWIKNRLRDKPRGEKLLRQELYNKGLSKEIVNKAIREEFSRQKIDELSLAKRTLGKKLPGYKKLDKPVAYRRAKSFLARRGFSYEVSEKLSRDLLGKNKLDYSD